MLNFLYTPVSWVLLQWHHLLDVLGLDPGGGLNWTLSIMLLVITARLLLFRLFVKQVKYQRHMQKMQPEIQKLRKKYKDDRAEMQRQMMKLQQEQGFNPLAGCLPMFAQIPIFIALYHVLRHLSNSVVHCGANGPKADYHGKLLSLYTFTPKETCQAAQARLFGGAPLAGRLTDTSAQIHNLHGAVDTTRITIIFLVLISASATYTTQRLVRAGQTTVPEGTAATVQRLMLYLVPLGTLFSGTFFPLGVLLYWFTSNLWTMLQQLYINKYHPQEKDETPQAGAVGKTLAPKPGQRPDRGKRSRVALSKPEPPPEAEAEVEDAVGDGATPAEPDTAPPPARAPRPGQRPVRQTGSGSANRSGGGNRSGTSNKRRPTQAKKRR